MIQRALAYDNFRQFLAEILRTRTPRMVAMRTGLSHTTILRIASGERQPMLSTARAVIDAYVGH